MKATPRKDARDNSLPTYDTGKPCPRGHEAPRYVSTGKCVDCSIEDAEAWNRANPVRYLANVRRRDQTPARRDQHRRREADKAGHARPLPESRYPRPADGRCECCGVHVGAAGLCYDHDHDLGSFLGWTCNGCNTLGDDIARLQRRIDYLRARGFR